MVLPAIRNDDGYMVALLDATFAQGSEIDRAGLSESREDRRGQSGALWQAGAGRLG